MMTYTTTDITITAPEPTKKEIIERLFTQGHITFNEMWTLLLDEPEVKYIPMPQPHDYYQMPYWTPSNPEPWTGNPLPGQEPSTICKG